MKEGEIYLSGYIDKDLNTRVKACLFPTTDKKSEKAPDYVFTVEVTDDKGETKMVSRGQFWKNKKKAKAGDL